MITKGIVEEIVDDYRVRVRIPVFDRTEQSNIHTKTQDLDVALICTVPGFDVHLRIGDVVFIDKDLREENPTILGFLYRAGLDGSRCDADLLNLTVDNSAHLPKDTTIGDVSTSVVFEYFKNIKGNIQQQIDELKSEITKLQSNYSVLQTQSVSSKEESSKDVDNSSDNNSGGDNSSSNTENNDNTSSTTIITIDPGHYTNYNKGAIKGYYEGNAMLNLAKYLCQEIRNNYSNVVVHLTRNDGKDVPINQRGKMAATNGSKLFISLHTNAEHNGTAHYVCAFRSITLPNSEELCAKLVDAVSDVMKRQNVPVQSTRKVWTRTLPDKTEVDYYGVIRNSVAGDSKVEYSILVEHGFHSHKQQCSFLMNNDNLRAIARAEAEVIAKALELRPIKEQNT